jgi:hypothetical protein
MALSDCEKCWDTPCQCGWYFREYDTHQLAAYIAKIVQYRSKLDASLVLAEAIEIMESNKQFKEKE